MTSFFDAMVVSFRSKFSVGRKEINTLHRFFSFLKHGDEEGLNRIVIKKKYTISLFMK
jgi:hypothetical protein